jgi:prepilin-type N-terminal cleavage/methylation domain-containing protein
MKRTRMLQTRRRHERGFTLVELMVAMVAGLFVSMAVFTLAKHASGFAMRQSRIADATLQSVIGFERLQADIARAGFLSSPNVVRDGLPRGSGHPGERVHPDHPRRPAIG